MSADIPLSDYIAIGNGVFDWVQSYDLKDWDLLRKTLAPEATLDFRRIKGVETIFENLTPDAFVGILSSPEVLGNKRLKSQHFIGSQRWERQDDTTVVVHNQIRVAHQMYNDDELTHVRNKGHAHGVTTTTFKIVQGEWKLSCAAATSEWSEYDMLGMLAGKENPKYAD